LARLQWLGIYTILTLLFAEGICRLIAPPASLPEDERSLLYHFDSELGWFPDPNRKHEFWASKKIFVSNNADGFRDVDHPAEKTKPRVLMLGDSFVWGYDVETEDRFTEHLQKKFPNYELFNMGVSGYGTDQEFLLFRRYFKHYKPDHVVLLFCTDNDFRDNSSNFVYDQYYAPYFVVQDGALKLAPGNVAVSESYIFRKYENIFTRSALLQAGLRVYGKLFLPNKFTQTNSDPTKELLLEFRGFVETHGISFSVVLTSPHKDLEKFLRESNIQYLSLSVPDHYRFPSYGNHWTGKGHQVAAAQMEPFFKARFRSHRLAGFHDRQN
jgi:hypothetical protein